MSNAWNKDNPPSDADFVRVKLRDLKPYHYAFWCRFPWVEEAVPVVVVAQREKGVSVMLECHVFPVVGGKPDDEVEVLPWLPSDWQRKRYADWRLGWWPRKTWSEPA